MSYLNTEGTGLQARCKVESLLIGISVVSACDNRVAVGNLRVDVNLRIFLTVDVDIYGFIEVIACNLGESLGTLLVKSQTYGIVILFVDSDVSRFEVVATDY